MGLRDDFMAMPEACDVCKRDVTDEVPALKKWLKDRRLFVRELSGPHRDVIEKEMSGDIVANPDGTQTIKRNAEAFRESRLICWCLVDERGERIFADADQEMVLVRLTGQVVSKLAKAITEVSGLTKKEKAGLEKNSGKAAGEGSSSGSPAILAGPALNGDLPKLAAAS